MFLCLKFNYKCFELEVDEFEALIEAKFYRQGMPFNVDSDLMHAHQLFVSV